MNGPRHLKLKNQKTHSEVVDHFPDLLDGPPAQWRGLDVIKGHRAFDLDGHTFTEYVEFVHESLDTITVLRTILFDPAGVELLRVTL